MKSFTERPNFKLDTKNKTLYLLALLLFNFAVPAFSQTIPAIDPNTILSGGQITAGSGSISQSGLNITINTFSNSSISAWTSLNLGANASLGVWQPTSDSVHLMRGLGNAASVFDGAVNSNARLFIVNPNGIAPPGGMLELSMRVLNS